MDTNDQKNVTPAVSFIVTAYKVDEFITNCVRSILNQYKTEFLHFEVIIIDDGNQIPVSEIIPSALLRDNVRVIRQDNSGVAAARNAGIRASQGEYISIVDGDDEVLPFHFLTIIEQIQKHPLEDVFAINAYPFEGKISRPFVTTQQHPRNWIPSVEGFLDGTSHVLAFGVVKRSAIEQIGYYDEEYRRGPEDFELWLRFLLSGARFRYFPYPTYLYRQHTQSITKIEPEALEKRRLLALNKTLSRRNITEKDRLAVQKHTARAFFINSIAEFKILFHLNDWQKAWKCAMAIDLNQAVGIQKSKLRLAIWIVLCMKIATGIFK